MIPPSRLMKTLAVVLALNIPHAIANGTNEEQTEAQAPCENCNKIKSGLFSPEGFLLFDFMASKPCYPPKKYYVAAKSRKGLLLLHTMELVVKQKEQENLKKGLSQTPEEAAGEVKRAIQRDKEIIQKLKSNIEFYARKIEEQEDQSAPWYVAIFKSSVWSIGFFQDYWRYLAKIHPNIKMGNAKDDDFTITCDHKQQARM